MKHKIEFYKFEEIPTGLRLLVDDEIHISYMKVGLQFAFEFSTPCSMELAEEIIDEVIQIIERQSFDHWSQYRLTNKEMVEERLGDIIYPAARVEFRIRDSY